MNRDDPARDSWAAGWAAGIREKRAVPTIYVVTEPGWEGGFDSAWTTEEQAQDRADALDPHEDANHTRWGIIGTYVLDSDPDKEEWDPANPHRSVPRRPL